MFAKKKEQLSDSKISTIISEGCVIDGTIKSEGSVRIDGQINGNVMVQQGVILGAHGQINGDVSAIELVTHGAISGNIHAETLEIKATAVIKGDISTSQMAMEFGAQHNGRVNMGKAAPAPLNKTSAPQAEVV